MMIHVKTDLLNSYLDQRLTDANKSGLLRALGNSKGQIDFASNDYLGLARSDALHDLINKKIGTLKDYKNGATGSRLLTGNSPYTEHVEKKLAAIFNAESCLLFNSGYTANLAILSSIPQKDDTIIYDELAHASIKDGARLSLAKRYSFRHNDLEDLKKKLKHASGKVFVAVESIYSMDGDSSPLKELADFSKEYGFTIILDEAHSTGLWGDQGSGLAVSLSLHDSIAIRLYTFGKAMGVHGACVAGSQKLIDYLINFARPFIYTTALTPHSVASIECSFKYLQDNIGLQETLRDKIDRFRKSLPEHLNRTESNSTIQTAIFPGNNEVRSIAGKFQQKGFDVRPILSPTVPPGKERLRICLHTFNSDEEIDELTATFHKLVSNRTLT